MAENCSAGTPMEPSVSRSHIGDSTTIPADQPLKQLNGGHPTPQHSVQRLNGFLLLVVACEPLAQITAVDASQYPFASSCLAYLDTGGQVICPERGLSLRGGQLDGDEDAIAQILKFKP